MLRLIFSLKLFQVIITNRSYQSYIHSQGRKERDYPPLVLSLFSKRVWEFLVLAKKQPKHKEETLTTTNKTLQVSTWISFLECCLCRGTAQVRAHPIPTSLYQYHLPVLCDFALLFRLVVGEQPRRRGEQGKEVSHPPNVNLDLNNPFTNSQLLWVRVRTGCSGRGHRTFADTRAEGLFVNTYDNLVTFLQLLSSSPLSRSAD